MSELLWTSIKPSLVLAAHVRTHVEPLGAECQTHLQLLTNCANYADVVNNNLTAHCVTYYNLFCSVTKHSCDVSQCEEQRSSHTDHSHWSELPHTRKQCAPGSNQRKVNPAVVCFSQQKSNHPQYVNRVVVKPRMLQTSFTRKETAFCEAHCNCILTAGAKLGSHTVTQYFKVTFQVLHIDPD